MRVVQWPDKLSTALIMNSDMVHCTADGLISRLGSEYSGIGPAAVLGERQSWHRWVPDVRAESIQLAGQLNLM